MNMSFLFPKLVKTIFEEADGVPGKDCSVSDKEVYFQDHSMLEYKLYFPRDIKAFITQFLEQCVGFQFRGVDLHGNENTSKTKSNSIFSASQGS